MPKLKNKKIIIFFLILVLFFGLFQLVYAAIKNIGETATITVSCSDSDGNLFQCNVTSPCTETCSASGFSGSCSCEFTCTTGGTFDACGEAKDTWGLTDSQCLDTVICNSPPTADISCEIENCDGPGCECNANWVTYNGESVSYHIINNSSDPDPGDRIVKSTWSIVGWQDPWFDCPGICNMTIPKISAGDYTIKLEVEDEGGLSDSTSHPIKVKQEAIAGFMCSLDNENWQVCEDLSPAQGELVYFKDDPSLTEHSTPSEGATLITSRIWKINGEVFDSDNNPNPSYNLTETSNDIELTITDNQGRTDSKIHNIGTTLPLPEWQEIPPFIWLRNFFASIAEFLGIGC